MGSPATPITPAPTPSSVHSQEDVVFNRIQAKMSANVAAHPEQADPNLIINDPLSGTPPPASPGTEESLVAGEVNLDDLDLSDTAPTPVEQAPQPVLGKDGRDPAEIEKELKSEIERLTGEGVTDKALWDKVGAIVLAHPRGQRMMQGLRLHQALTEAPKEDGTGGLGRLPSLDEIKAGDSAMREVTQLRHDLENDPNNFVSNLFGIADNGRSWLGSPDRAAAVAASIPTFLFQAFDQTKSPVYTQMIGAMATPIIQRMFDHQYQQALALPPGQTREIVLYSLQVAEHNVVGEARMLPSAPGPAGTNGAPQQRDPRYSQLEEQFKQAHTELNQLKQSSQQDFARHVNNSNRGNALAAIDKVLEHVGITKVFSNELLAPHRMALVQLIEQELPRINGAGYDAYLRQVTDAANRRAPLDGAITLYKNLIANGIKVSPVFRERLNALVKSAGQMSTQRTNVRVNGQSQVGPAGAGAPAATSVLPTGPKIDRLPGESQEDFYSRRIAAKMR